ncbi:hypothetical protein LCGC14_1703710, partial [marine sediment metagenome]
SDEAYVFPIVYKRETPLDVPSGHDDYKGEGDIIPMPVAMHNLWHLNALYRCQRAFRADDSWKATYGHYRGQLIIAKQEKDSPDTGRLEPNRDGYGDVDAVGAGRVGYEPRLRQLPTG